jgi:hypothetical protein
MAMATMIHMVTDDEIAALAKEPASINRLPVRKGETFHTHLYTAINYFLCGSAYPDGKKPLALALGGERNVETPTLENGSFDVTSSPSVAKIADALAKVDLKAIGKKISAADFDELRDEEEVDEEEVLSGSDDPVAELIGEIEGLQQFYAAAKEKQKGVAIYTS